MKAAVVVFPGSNCDRDCRVALERTTGAEVTMVWHRETALPAGLAEFTNDGKFIRKIAMPEGSPYGYDVAIQPDLNRMVTSGFTFAGGLPTTSPSSSRRR